MKMPTQADTHIVTAQFRDGTITAFLAPNENVADQFARDIVNDPEGPGALVATVSRIICAYGARQ